jgi:hypothetical protein
MSEYENQVIPGMCEESLQDKIDRCEWNLWMLSQELERLYSIGKVEARRREIRRQSHEESK